MHAWESDRSRIIVLHRFVTTESDDFHYRIMGAYSSPIPNFILMGATKNPAVQDIAQQNIIDSKAHCGERVAEHAPPKHR